MHFQPEEVSRERLYDAEEQKRILELAMRFQDQLAGKASIGELERVGSEMGISADYIQRAARQLAGPEVVTPRAPGSGYKLSGSITAACVVLVFVLNQYFLTSMFRYEISFSWRTGLMALVLSAIFYKSNRLRVAGFAVILSSAVGSLIIHFLSSRVTHQYLNVGWAGQGLARLVILETVIYAVGCVIATLVQKSFAPNEIAAESSFDLR